MLIDWRASLSRRLAAAIVLPLALFAIALGLGGAVVTHRLVDRTSDRLLGGSVRAVMETVTVENGAVWVNLPPWALGVLDNPQRDSVFYSVRQDGVLLTGYSDLPQMDVAPAMAREPAFRYIRYQGRWVRQAAQAREFPGASGEVVVSVAQTLESRHAVRNALWAWLAVVEVMLVILAGFLVWPAAVWSLRPLDRLRSVLDSRSESQQADFRPAPMSDVPRELVAVVIAFNGLLGRLASVTDRERRFTADASHQIRTPLTILRTNLTLIQRTRGLSSSNRAALADASTAADRLQGLLLQLISLARAEGPEGGVEHGPISLARCARYAVAQFKPSIVDLECRVVEDVEVSASALLLEDMLTNLIDNAIRYGQNSPVEVRVFRNGGWGCVSIEDGGPGIPPDERERVMERFYRSARHANIRGSGLGLSIVKTLADRQDATIELTEGRHGRGLRVILSFPELQMSALGKQDVQGCERPA